MLNVNFLFMGVSGQATGAVAHEMFRCYFNEFGYAVGQAQLCLANDVSVLKSAGANRGFEGGGQPRYGLQARAFGMCCGYGCHQRAGVSVAGVLHQLLGRGAFQNTARVHNLDAVSIAPHHA